MPRKSHRVCPIAGCRESIPGDHLMCQKHFKMMPRKTQCDFFGEQAKYEAGETDGKEFYRIQNLAVKQVAEECASRRENSRQAVQKLQSLFA